MLDRLGRAAAKHQMYLVVCSDLVEADGKTYNTAFFLDRDGKEIGRYHKVCPTWGESGSRECGKSLSQERPREFRIREAFMVAQDRRLAKGLNDPGELTGG